MHGDDQGIMPGRELDGAARQQPACIALGEYQLAGSLQRDER
jgi:hypothetical protein